jgi:inner membrane protein
MALGASVSAACVSRGDKRRAAILGAALGTLPDLDILIRYADPIDNFIEHRGFSHSLFILIPLSILIWLFAKQLSDRVARAPYPWLAAISLALVTHPILDAHTVYGTQLFWPLNNPPLMWSTVFIIDPIYTLPLVIIALTAIIAPRWRGTQKALAIGLILSSFYLSWSWVAKSLVTQKFASYMEVKDISYKKYFTVPTPFNTLLWRIVAMTPEGYYEGFYSLMKPMSPINFKFIKIDPTMQTIASTHDAYKKLNWFSHGFLKTEVIDDQLIISDLRMGLEPDYVFRFAISDKKSGEWRPITPLKIGTRYDRSKLGELFKLL